MVVTIDADLQNPPEEIPRLLAEVDAGYDVVGTRRAARVDPFPRRALSAAVSRLASLAVGVPMTDCGSMLRAYRRPVVDAVVQLADRALFIPALAAWVATRPTEIAIAHEPRAAGRSRYSPLRFMRLGFDLMTGFSLVPIQLVSLAGIGVSLVGTGFGIYLSFDAWSSVPKARGCSRSSRSCSSSSGSSSSPSAWSASTSAASTPRYAAGPRTWCAPSMRASQKARRG